MESPVSLAWKKKTALPAFNIPYLPMMTPVVQALRDTKTFGFIMVARLEWEKFQAGSLETIAEEYSKVGDENFTRLHLDHIPVIDEDGRKVDFISIIQKALKCGYHSVMVDGSRLSLEENIKNTTKVVALAHVQKVPVEGELGTVLGHEAGPLPDYEDLFSTGFGFTDPEEAGLFVEQTGVDWLSVAIGNIHGAISASIRNKPKVRARLNISHLQALQQRTKIPLVLHGGTGLSKEDLQAAVQHGIAKVNVATGIRQVYERWMNISVTKAQEEVYQKVIRILKEELCLAGNFCEDFKLFF